MDLVVIKKLNKIHTKYNKLLTQNEREMFIVVRQWFNFMLRQIRKDLSGKYFKKDIASEFTNWNNIKNGGVRIVKPAAMAVYASGGDMANKILNVPGGFDTLTIDATKQVNKMTAKLVVEVSEETKKGIRIFIKEGIKVGKGMPKIARELRPLVGLTESQTQSIINYKKILETKHPEMSAKMRDYKTRQYVSKTQTRRLNTIARTETANAQNDGYVQSMKEMGVEQLEFSAVTNACKICAGMDGNIYDVDKAAGLISVHPSCRCAMLPVVDGNTITSPLKKPPSELKPPVEPVKPVVPESKVPLQASKMNNTIDEMIQGSKEWEIPLECHQSVATLESVYGKRKGVKYIVWDEDNADDIIRLLDPSKVLTKDFEVKDLLSGIKDGTVNGHSFVKVGDSYVDPYFRSLNVPQSEINKVDKYLANLYKKAEK